MLAVAAALWSGFFVIPYQLAGRAMAPEAVALVMLGCAAVLNSVLLGAQRTRHKSSLRRPLWTPLVLALLAALGNYFSAQALAALAPATVSAVFRSEVVWVAVLGALVLRERPSLATVLGGSLAIAGLWLMKPLGASLPNASAGWLHAVGASLCFASMQLVIRSVAVGSDLFWINSVRLWLSVLVLAAIPGAIRSALAAPPLAWGLCLAAAAAGPVVSRLLAMYALRILHANEVSLIALLAPPFTLLLGWLWFGDLPDVRALLGGGLILMGVALPLAQQLPWRRAP